MVKTDETLKVLKKYGTCVHQYVSKRDPGLYTAICPGCRKEIRSDGDLSNVEFSVSKRGGAVIFHHDCYLKTWNSKIPTSVR